MRSVIGNKLASLYQLTKQNNAFWLLCTNLQNKTQYRWDVPFASCKKVSISILCQKFFMSIRHSRVIVPFPPKNLVPHSSKNKSPYLIFEISLQNHCLIFSPPLPTLPASILLYQHGSKC